MARSLRIEFPGAFYHDEIKGRGYFVNDGSRPPLFYPLAESSAPLHDPDLNLAIDRLGVALQRPQTGQRMPGFKARHHRLSGSHPARDLFLSQVSFLPRLDELGR